MALTTRRWVLLVVAFVFIVAQSSPICEFCVEGGVTKASDGCPFDLRPLER